MNKTFTCIICPRGCSITVDDNLNVTGNSCPRGKEYVLNEIKAPKRTLTTSVRVSNRKDTLVSVKTSCAIPKEKIFDLMNEINQVKVEAPIKIGDVVAHNPLDIETDIIVTKNID